MNNTPIRILLLAPNIIGYVRLFFLVIFLFTAFRWPVLAFWTYFVSALLDALDGFLARKLHQTSKFGTMLDFAQDRATIAALELVLAIIFPKFWLVFCLLMLIDIFSHICQLYSTVFLKAESHKILSRNQTGLLRLYYTSRTVLFFTCFSHDGFLLALYGYHFVAHFVFQIFMLLLFPGFCFKLLIHLLQIKNQSRCLIELDMESSKNADEAISKESRL